MKLRELLTMQTSFSLAASFGWALIVPYFISLGYSQIDVLMYTLSFFTFSLITLQFTRNWKIKNYLTFGLIMRTITFLVAMKVVHPLQLMLIGIFFSFIITDYWIIYNRLIQDTTKKTNRAFISGITMSIFPIVGIVAPVMAGYVADNFGFFWLLLGGALLMPIPIYLSRKMSDKRMLINLCRAEHNNPQIREIMFIEGFADASSWVIPPFVILTFVTSNLEFGSFFSYLALVGAVSAILLGRRSDREGKRGKYIVPIVLINGLALIVAGLSNSLLMWAIALSVNSLVKQVEWPFTWAMVTDSAKGIGDAMIVREYWLNAGRMCLIVLTIATVVFMGDIKYGLIIGGFAYSLFPVFMKLRKLG